MAGMTEHNSVQQPLVDELVRLGWSYFPGKSLDRQLEQVSCSNSTKVEKATRTTYYLRCNW